jgi:hypothetical protein
MKFLILCVCALVSGVAMSQDHSTGLIFSDEVVPERSTGLIFSDEYPLQHSTGLRPSELPELEDHVRVLKIGPDVFNMHSATRTASESALLHRFTPHHEVSIDLASANFQTKNAMAFMEQQTNMFRHEDRIYFLCRASSDKVDNFNLKLKSIDFCIDTRTHQVVVNLLPRVITVQEVQEVINEGRRNPEDEMVNNSSRNSQKNQVPQLSLEDFESSAVRQ